MQSFGFYFTHYFTEFWQLKTNMESTRNIWIKYRNTLLHVKSKKSVFRCLIMWYFTLKNVFTDLADHFIYHWLSQNTCKLNWKQTKIIKSNVIKYTGVYLWPELLSSFNQLKKSLPVTEHYWFVIFQFNSEVEHAPKQSTLQSIFVFISNIS